MTRRQHGKNGIFWLASYPKSGNTWMRIFLTNYGRNSTKPADINHLDRTPISSARPFFDEYAGVEASDLTPDEIQAARPHVYRLHGRDGLHYMKAHDAYLILPDGSPLFPVDVTRGAIYMIRNPLDVAVSYAAHDGTSIDKIIQRMSKPHVTLAENPRDLPDQLPQYLGTWSSHAESWLNAPVPVLVVRYEDLSSNPAQQFTNVVRFVGAPYDPVRLRRAIAFSSFSELRRQEDEQGFRERTAPNLRFFRKGKVGNWRESLTSEQAAQIIHDHRDMMQRFGYLTPAGEVAY